MLQQLRIKDFAIIDDLTIKFRSGLNVLTGETGAGKSIVVDAFGLALGERAQTDMIRTGRNETIIEAFLDMPAHPLLEQLGIPSDDGIILRRNLSSTGKSRAYINDTMINVQTLLAVGVTLVDIHGQHEHQSLLSTDNQRIMLDAYAKLTELSSAFGKLFHEVQSIKAMLSKSRSDIRERNERIDLLRFQINEIDSASLKSDEKEKLIEEKAILSNLAKLNELTDLAHSLLYSGEGSVQDKLSSAHSAIKEISAIDNSAAEVLDLIDGARPLIDDATISLRRYKDRYDVDPDRLEAIEERLDLIRKFEKKYGEGIDSILAFRENAARELEGLTLSDERLQDIEKTLVAKEMQLNEEAFKLSIMRKEAAGRLEAEIISALKELALEKAEFRVAVRECPVSSAGIDNIEFLFSANKGEPPKSLSKTASGGELSRIMLALKETFAEVDKIPVLIFDEVDAGIGGRTAESVGISLKKLSKKHQVLCITHLPQIAAMADHHIVIEKAEKKGGVSVRVIEPSQKEREQEIARMLSGKVTDISVKHARELIERVS